MAIEIKTIDIILSIASIAIFIIVFFSVFHFRKKKKATRDHEKEVEELVVAVSVEKIKENIRDAEPEQIQMPETAELKLEDVFPEQEFSEKPADVKSSDHESLNNENVELKLEDEFPEKSSDIKIAELKIEISESAELKLEDILPEKASDIEDPVLKTEIPENADLRLEDPFPEKMSDSKTAKIFVNINRR